MKRFLLLSMVMVLGSVSYSWAQKGISTEGIENNRTEVYGSDIIYQDQLNSSMIRQKMEQQVAERRRHIPFTQSASASANPVLGSIFKNYVPENTGTNGMSRSFTRFIYEDAEGQLFMGGNGIDVWNGIGWENYNFNNSMLPSNIVFDMIQDHKGNYWFATNGGLVHWEKSTEMVQVITPDNSSIRSNRTRTLHLDASGRIWVGHSYDTTYEGGVSVLNDNGAVLFTIAGEEGLYGNAIEDFAEDRSNNLIYIATGPDPATGLYGGINVWDLNNAAIDTFYNKDNSNLPYNEVTSLLVDDQGNLWAGLYMNNGIGHTEGGLVKFDGTNFTHYSEDKGNSVGRVIISIYQDDNGELWIGASDGVYTYDGSTFSVVAGGTDGGNALANVNDITPLSDGRIAFSKFNSNLTGGGISIWDPLNGTWEHMSSRDGGVNSQVYFGADYDSQGNLWVTGFNGLQKFDGENWQLWTANEGLAATYGWDLIVDQSDNVWVNGAENGITKIHADGTLETINTYGKFVESNYEDSNGGLWFGDWYTQAESGGYYSNGILYYDGTNYTVFDSTDGLPTGYLGAVISIAEDQQGRILAATYDGLYRLENGAFSKWMYDGYTSGGVYKLHLDSQDRLWISNGAMISLYDGTNWTHFGEFDGVEGYAEDIEEDLSGRVWLLQSDGAAVYENGTFYRVSGRNGVPGVTLYDLAPSKTDASVMALAAYFGGVTISSTEVPVTINSISDNPDDQGGWIRMSVDGYLFSEHYTGESADGWRAEINMDGNWEAAAPVSPASSKTISVQVPVTKPTGVSPDASNSFEFRVVAINSEGEPIGFSETAIGFAEDNIAPSQVVGVVADVTPDNKIEMSWDAVPDNDVDGYAIFEAGITDFANTTPITFSTSLQATFDNAGYNELVVVAVDRNNNFGTASESAMATSNEKLTALPKEFKLGQNYPNPFNPTTKIHFELPQSSKVRLTVFNTLGQEVATLLNEVKAAGSYEVDFNADQMNSGMYIYRIEAGSFTKTRKMMLIK